MQVAHLSLDGTEMAFHGVFPLVLVFVSELHRFHLSPIHRTASLLDICWGKSVHFREKKKKETEKQNLKTKPPRSYHAEMDADSILVYTFTNALYYLTKLDCTSIFYKSCI